jgi:hypothetical protein
VILIPDELQINDVLQAEIRKTYSPELDKDQWDITLPNTILSGRLNDLGIHYIDLYPYFERQSRRQLYRPRDTHWNIAGNRLAANIIHDHLREYIRDTD